MSGVTSAGGTNARSARRLAREFALRGVYEWLVSGNSALQIEQHLAVTAGDPEYSLDATDAGVGAESKDSADRGADFAQADLAYFRALLHGSIAQAADLQDRFAAYLDRSVGELSPVEHAVLLLAAFELATHPEVPYRVVINEAIELTKEFGGAEGHRYVNGVLDRLAAELRAVEVEAARAIRR